MCCLRRQRKNSGMLLPVTLDSVHSDSPSSDYMSRISNQYSSAATTSWQSYNHQRHDGRGGVSYGQDPLGSNQVQQLATGFSADAEDAGEQDIDFFSDMKPRIKRQRKVLLSTDSNSPEQLVNPSKFNVDLKANIVTVSNDDTVYWLLTNRVDQQGSAELGVIEEDQFVNYGTVRDEWQEEPLDIEESLRIAREEERQRRLADHQRIKAIKEQERKARNAKSIAATKISWSQLATVY